MQGPFSCSAIVRNQCLLKGKWPRIPVEGGQRRPPPTVSVSAFVLGQVTACGGAHTRERPPQDALSLFAASLTAVKKGGCGARPQPKNTRPASKELTSRVRQPGLKE